VLVLGMLGGCAPAWPQNLPAARSEVAVDRRSIEEMLAAQREQVCSSRNRVGTGLRGQYFSITGCEGHPRTTRLDGPVELEGTPDWPSGEIRSIRWQGWVRAPLPGQYFFHMDGQAADVTIGRVLVLERTANQSEPIEFAAGRYYSVDVRVEARSPASLRARLSWTAPHGTKFLIPRASLYPPTT
jgi:PA14 domain